VRKTLGYWSFWIVDQKGRRSEVVKTKGWTWFDARDTAATLLGCDPQSKSLKWKGEPFAT
jgi:hypothetical protein